MSVNASSICRFLGLSSGTAANLFAISLKSTLLFSVSFSTAWILFKGWVFTIMRNIFINNYRRAFRSQTRIEPTDDLYHLDAASASAAAETPEGAYAASEVSEAIGRFAPEYREPFTMHLQGYRYSEIAERMQLPVGTIKSRIYYARQRLRQQLKDYAPGGAQ